MSDPLEPIDPADRELRALLRTLAHDQPDDGFSARLHMRLAADAAKGRQSHGLLARLRDELRAHPLFVGTLSGACSGIAAFGLLLAVTGWRPVANPSSSAPNAATSALNSPSAPGARAPGARAPGTGVPGTGALAAATPPACEPSAAAHASAEVFVVPEGKVALVQLDFAVDRDVETAEFSVLLPEGLAFFSNGQALPDRSFRWSAGLGQGNNRIPIAVIGTRPGVHHLTATATIAGEVVVHEVVLDVREPV